MEILVSKALKLVALAQVLMIDISHNCVSWKTTPLLLIGMTQQAMLLLVYDMNVCLHKSLYSFHI